MPAFRCLAAAIVVATAAGAHAQDAPPMMAGGAAETIRLWEGDAPGARGTADHDVPVVAWWPAAKQSSPSAAMVICPGGGYGALADHEGSDYARWLNAQGVSAALLQGRDRRRGLHTPRPDRLRR